MRLRAVLVALMLAATAAFVVGVAIERSAEAGHHDQSADVAPAEYVTGAAEEHEEAASVPGEAGEEHAVEELRPLGVDIEAWPFVAIAARHNQALIANIATTSNSRARYETRQPFRHVGGPRA